MVHLPQQPIITGCASVSCLHFAAILSNLRLSKRGEISNSTTEDNPLLDIDGLPDYKRINGDAVNVAIPILVNSTVQEHEIIEKKIAKMLKNNKSLTWDELIPPQEKLGDKIGAAWGAVSHLHSVKDSDDLRKAYTKNQPLLVAMGTKISQSLTIHAAYKNLNKRTDLDEAQRRIVNASVISGQHSGVDLPADKQKEFNKISPELAKITTQFSNNVLDSTKEFGFMIEDKKHLKGVPDSFFPQAAEAAGKELNKTVDPKTGPWKLSLDGPSYEPVMKHCTNSTLRQTMYMAYIQRAAHGKFNNSDILEKIRQLRGKKASILGFKSYAHLSTSSKMAGTPERVWKMLESLRDKCKAMAKKEFEDLREFAKSQNHTEELHHWDLAFWSNRQKEHLFNLKEEEVKQYFNLESTLSGLFKLVEQLFRINITEVEKGRFPTWDDEVRFFNIIDKDSGMYLASFFLDPYSRPSEKKAGAWMNSAIEKSDVYQRTAVAYLVCNQAPPINGTPSRMSLHEVETVFHEFGHGLQHMLTEVNYTSAAGINNIEWDAVELPSQFMENWLYDWTTIQSISSHFKTKEPLPEKIFKQILKSRKFMAGSGMLRQLYFSAIDMEFHTSSDPWRVVMERISANYTSLQPLKEDAFPCSFQHVFGGGYAAGYYSYKWAEVMAADAFSAFDEVGLQNRDRLAQIGLKFRHTVLGMGGAKDPNEVFRLFRGREPEPKALLNIYGLSQ